MNKAENKVTAAVLTDPRLPLSIVQGISVPPLQKGQVLVKLAYAGVCHSQLMEARGRRGRDIWLPHMLGHEGTGRVVEIGPGVTKVNVNDEVVLGWIKSEGLDAGGTTYVGPNGEKINAGPVTTFNSYSVVSENRIVRLPSSTPLHLGVLYGCALPTGAGLVINQAKPLTTDTVAIVGMGGIGLSALLACRILGLRDIICIDVEDHKLGLCLKLGAKHVFNPLKDDVKSEVLSLTSGRGVDISIEAAGTCQTIEFAYALIRRNGGRCIFASHPAHGTSIKLDPFDLICGKSIEGSWGGASKPDRDVAIMGEAYAAGQLPLEYMISEPYSLFEINKALDDLENRKITRALIRFDE